MNQFLKVKVFWHVFRKIYLQTQLQGCLDPSIVQNLKEKIQYHEIIIQKMKDK